MNLLDSGQCRHLIYTGIVNKYLIYYVPGSLKLGSPGQLIYLNRIHFQPSTKNKPNNNKCFLWSKENSPCRYFPRRWYHQESITQSKLSGSAMQSRKLSCSRLVGQEYNEHWCVFGVLKNQHHQNHTKLQCAVKRSLELAGKWVDCVTHRVSVPTLIAIILCDVIS